MFRPFPAERFKAGLTWRVNSSLITRWTSYISARVAQTVFEGGRKDQYAHWIDVFYKQITESSNSAELSAGELLTRLSGLYDVSFFSSLLRVRKYKLGDVVVVRQRVYNHRQRSRLSALHKMHSYIPPARNRISKHLDPRFYYFPMARPRHW